MLELFDVDHGSAALYTSPSGARLLFDCGHSAVTGFRPSQLLAAQRGVRGIERLYLSHADEDHVSDLPALVRSVRVQVLHRNRTIPNDVLRRLKASQGPIREGVEAYLSMDASYTTPLGLLYPEPVHDEVTVQEFRNAYPAFTDTNNLSLVCFVQFGGVRAILPGDLERAGWLALLQDPRFRFLLSQVNVFVASHHGRQNGYCGEVFDHCQPQIVIISDHGIQYGTQATRYDQHASGVAWGGGGVRRVLTTRRDGHITIHPGVQGRWTIRTQR